MLLRCSSMVYTVLYPQTFIEKWIYFQLSLAPIWKLYELLCHNRIMNNELFAKKKENAKLPRVLIFTHFTSVKHTF